MQQIMMIHGGTTFRKKEDYINFLKTRDISIEDKKRWSDDYIKEELSDCKIIKPRMPLKEDAKYEDWKIHFERHLPYLEDNIILIGTSLGGIFLAKYLSENIFPKRILSVYLIAPPFDDTIKGEDLAGGFELKEDLKLIEKNCSNITLMFSKDDDVVPVEHAEKYREKINAEIIKFGSRNGHFDIEEFPELVERIRKDMA
ncbi:MAG: alpha/beta hydrolase [Nanobdellota archaeon]